MKKLILFILLCPFSVKAQFHDVRPIKIIKEVELAVREIKADSLHVDTVEIPKAAKREKKKQQTPKIPKQIAIAMPLANLQQTSSFGWRKHPIFKDWRRHQGVDFASNKDSVYAVLNGKVIDEGYSSSLGYYLKIKHTESLTTLYAHLSQYYFKKGEEVKAGDPIALTGSTGWSTGDHLHLGVYQNGKAIDPIEFLTSLLNFNNTMKENHIKSAALEKLKLIAQSENPVTLSKEEQKLLQVETWDQENILEESEEENE